LGAYIVVKRRREEIWEEVVENKERGGEKEG
jgi:hypothetical protein